MVRRLAALDTTPLTRPVWVTLTLPGRLDDCAAAATGPEYRKAMKRLWSRWERRWGVPAAAAAFKIEFTTGGRDGDRVAPHLHLLATVPDGESLGEWHCWLARAWVGAVGPSGLTDAERSAWLWAGTWVEVVEGDEPARRAARYFAYWKPGRWGRHQDQPPDSWLAPGCGLRRLWGVRGLAALEVEHEASSAAAEVWERRLLRRWADANLPPPMRRRRRPSGRLVRLRRKWPINAQGGWLIVPGGRADGVAAQVAAAAERLAGGNPGSSVATRPRSGWGGSGLEGSSVERRAS